MLTTIRRLDAGRLGKISRTPQGGARVPAALTRTGVLPYRNADGSTRREYRPPSEVFRSDSLATLQSAPVTHGHAAWISSDNWREHALGHVAEGSVRQDGSFLAAELVLQDGSSVGRVDAAELGEISMGYTCDFDPTSGVSPEGERYDGIQRNIRYNHVALLPPGAGRAGRDVAVRLDALESFDDSGPRAALVAELAKLDPQFRTDGKSDDYLRARLDDARERQPETADAAAAAMRHRNAEAWKRPEQRTDAAGAIDPDEAQQRMKKRNEEAWKGKDGVQLLKQLEGDDTDGERMGPVGMR